jgi:hypothetical protein
MSQVEEGTSAKLELVTLSDLKTVYRLTPKWIVDLGNPDKLKTNPYRRSGPPMRLYLRERVEAFIDQNRAAYEAMQQKRDKQVETGTAVAHRRWQQTMAWAESVELEFGQLPENLQAAATQHFGHLQAVRGGPRDNELVGMVNERGVIAMLRHEYSNYHLLLNELFGQVGRWQAYAVIRDRINQRACELAGIEFGEASDWAKGEDKWLSGRWGEGIGKE